MAERQFPAAVGNLTSTFNRIRTAFIAAADDPTTKVRNVCCPRQYIPIDLIFIRSSKVLVLQRLHGVVWPQESHF